MSARLSLGQAARIAGVCEHAVRRAIRSGRLKAARRKDVRILDRPRGAYSIDPEDLKLFRPLTTWSASAPEQRRCCDCGALFARKHPHAKFCSDQCLQNAYRRRKRTREAEQRARRRDAP
jgi:hypothetical protein